jgi:hypothetical protein
MKGLKIRKKNDASKIKTLLPGECFNGEVWKMCPYCGFGIEVHGIDEGVNTCRRCEKKYRYSREE